MKRTKTKKLVFTDGKLYYDNRGVSEAYFTENVKEAHNFFCERFPELNQKKYLDFELGFATGLKPVVYNKKKRITEETKIDISKFTLKWVIIIETIKEENFNYEDFC
jgi:hypothetical protein